MMYSSQYTCFIFSCTAGKSPIIHLFVTHYTRIIRVVHKRYSCTLIAPVDTSACDNIVSTMNLRASLVSTSCLIHLMDKLLSINTGIKR